MAGDHHPSEEEYQMILAARLGLWSGDLGPLAAYMRSGFEIHDWVRREIASAIDGVPALRGDSAPPFRMKLTKSGKPGPGNPISNMQKVMRDLKIYAYVSEMSAAESQMESVISAAGHHFNLKRSSVMAAVNRAKKKWGAALPEVLKDIQEFK